MSENATSNAAQDVSQHFTALNNLVESLKQISFTHPEQEPPRRGGERRSITQPMRVASPGRQSRSDQDRRVNRLHPTEVLVEWQKTHALRHCSNAEQSPIMGATSSNFNSVSASHLSEIGHSYTDREPYEHPCEQADATTVCVAGARRHQDRIGQVSVGDTTVHEKVAEGSVKHAMKCSHVAVYVSR